MPLQGSVRGRFGGWLRPTAARRWPGGLQSASWAEAVGTLLVAGGLTWLKPLQHKSIWSDELRSGEECGRHRSPNHASAWFAPKGFSAASNRHRRSSSSLVALIGQIPDRCRHCIANRQPGWASGLYPLAAILWVGRRRIRSATAAARSASLQCALAVSCSSRALVAEFMPIDLP